MKKIYFLITLCVSSAQAQVINFTDAGLKNSILASEATNNIAKDLSGNYFAVDANGDDEIDQTEAAAVSSLDFSNGSFPIDDLTSLLNFTNVEYLNISWIQAPLIDISGFQHLEFLDCSSNYQIAVLNLSSSTLKTLYCADLGANTLSFSGLPALENVNYDTCWALDHVDFTGATSLKKISGREATLESIDLSPAINAEDIDVLASGLTTINVGELPHLASLSVSYNAISVLDLSGCPVLESLLCDENPNLTLLYLKNGAAESIYSFNTPNLIYICADDSQVAELQSTVPSTCEVNSYCSFTPGGEYFTVNGNSNIDLDNNGCGGSDPLYPGIKLMINNGMTTSTYIANIIGNYALSMQAGSYDITPVIENPYYIASPSQFSVNFPADGNTITQNICVVPDGIHNDLEVVILPVNPARPGFNASYQLLFRNVGNTTLQTNMNLQFDDNVMDFVQSVPMPSSQSVGTLDWMNLSIAPFETRTVLLTMNMNSPTDTPALNNGDQIDFTASLSYNGTDETPSNNIDEFTQTLVNSFDPNDKTCLEGDTISPEMAGDYVHYLIRFENTGTFPAENVVVKDIIDTAKLDINSLVPINSNYEFTTRITDTNKVEFIFENINLPFDDANNDGCILFKIKTKPTLTLGNTISNTASIYFDYNFPIVTNTATTTVALPLGVDENENSFGFALYPNPTKNTLNISSKINASINEILIYNTLGQEVMKVIPAVGDNSIDVSRLAEGSYVVKVNCETGGWSGQFVKN